MPVLLIVPAVPVWIDGDYLIFDRKFYDGMLFITKRWKGQVRCVMSKSDQEKPAFGLVVKLAAELPFLCSVMGNKKIGIEDVEGANVVLAAGDSDWQLNISNLARSLNIKCVYIIENTPEVRRQIVSFETKNIIILLRRFFYIWNVERKRTAAFSVADGLQINGSAAFNEYKHKNALLYFDARVGYADIINVDELNLRLKFLDESRPLRLAFSGRLIHMKGADHLIDVALQLVKINCNFSLDIFGAGELEDKMTQKIISNKLENKVFMRGAVDFNVELLPWLKHRVDLFLCLHRQSDPSCTYLETLSCGVPIVGYLNKAFSGLLERADIGWGAALDDREEVADIILRLDSNRREIVEKSKNGMFFSHHHEWEATFQKRLDHLASVVN